ncbi:MAG: methylated-DNA--[protein]-cysteine S-methyltransferase [Nitrosospira sp.]
MRLWLERRSSPLGTVLIVTDDRSSLRALDFVDYEQRLHRLLRIHYRTYELTDGLAPKSITQTLDAYFAGDFEVLLDVPVATGGTDFQREVWQALRRISAGKTISYGQLATSLGRPNAGRAVGLAVGGNPVAIVVPCHRVIGANGTLTGYGGGLYRKRWLLDHEHQGHRLPSTQLARTNVSSINPARGAATDAKATRRSESITPPKCSLGAG